MGVITKMFSVNHDRSCTLRAPPPLCLCLSGSIHPPLTLQSLFSMSHKMTSVNSMKWRHFQMFSSEDWNMNGRLMHATRQQQWKRTKILPAVKDLEYDRLQPNIKQTSPFCCGNLLFSYCFPPRSFLLSFPECLASLPLSSFWTWQRWWLWFFRSQSEN